MPITLREYTAGDLIRFHAEFSSNDTNLPLDPSSVEFSYRIEGGTPVRFIYGTDPQLTRTGLGNYEIEIDSTNKPGKWDYIWASENLGQAVLSKAVIVHPPAITPDFS